MICALLFLCHQSPISSHLEAQYQHSLLRLEVKTQLRRVAATIVAVNVCEDRGSPDIIGVGSSGAKPSREPR